MPVTAERAPAMAKKKTGSVDPPTKAVKIDRALAGKAQIIATDRGMPTADYISEVLRSQVEKDWAKVVRKLGEEA